MIELSYRGVDGIFGEMSLIDNKPRSATAVARTDTICYTLDEKSFRKYLMELNPFAYRIFQTLAETVRNMNKEIKKEKDE